MTNQHSKQGGQTEHEHKWIYKGIEYKIADYCLAGSGAKPVMYFEVFFCERCLAKKASELDERTDTYQKIKFDATPKTGEYL